MIANGGADYLAQPDSVGRPAPTADVRVVDDDGRDVAEGEIGEIWIRGPNVIPGYWRNPEATEAAFGGGWFRTGDLGYRDEAGLYYVVDRKKDVIIRGGENVYCAEVEAMLLEHPRVRDAAVVGLPHADYGEEVAAVIQVAAADHRRRRGGHPGEPRRPPGALQDPHRHPPRRGRPAAHRHRQGAEARAARPLHPAGIVTRSKRHMPNGGTAMGLKTPAEYVQSLRDGRVTYWDGERIDDITIHPKFRIPIAVAARDYDYADPARREVMTYRTEDGERRRTASSRSRAARPTSRSASS